MKPCIKCGQTKPLANFYKHKQMLDGHLNECKKCTKKRVNKHRYENIDSAREYDRSRSNLPHRVKARKDYQKTDEFKESHAKAIKKYRKNNPKKVKAHRVV